MLLPPVVVDCPEVAFPSGYEAGGDQVVELQLLIEETGLIRVTDGIGPQPFLFLARHAVQRCSIEPATEDGSPVAVEIPMRWEFHVPAPTVPAPGDTPEGIGLYTKERTTGVVRTLTAEEIALAPGTLGDPVRAVQNLPGVIRTPFDAGWLLVRGGDVDDTSVTLDGVRIPLLFHLGGHTSVLHPSMVQEVAFHPGTPPARIGRANSGSINLVPRVLDGTGGLSAGVNTGYAHAFVEAPVPGGGVAIAGRRSYLDGILALVAGPGGAAVAPTFTDGALRIDAGPFGLTAMGMSDTALVPTGDDDEAATLTQTATQWQTRLSGKLGSGTLEARAWLAAQRQQAVTETRDQQLSHLAPGGRLEWRQRGDIDATAGVEAELRRFAVDWNGLAKSSPTGMVDPYAEAAFGDRFRTRLGVRLDTLWIPDQLPRLDLSPRGDFHWAISDRFGVVGEAARLNMPAPFLYLVGLPDGPYLPFDQSHSAGLGFRLNQGIWSFDVDGWARTMRQSGFEEDRSLGPRQGRAAGVESTLHLNSDTTSARLVFQWSRAMERDEAADDWRATRYDQPVRVVALLLRELPRSWVVSGRARYGSGYPHTTSLTSAYDVLLQQRRPIEVSPAGRLPPFYALDLKASKHFEWNHARMDVYVDIQNVSSRRIPEPVINGIDDDVIIYGFGLPVLPLFGVEGTFYPSDFQARDAATSSR